MTDTQAKDTTSAADGAPDPAAVHGPIDFLMLEFPTHKMDGAAGATLLDLVQRDVVRIYDLLVIRKEHDGSFSGFDVTDLSADEIGGFTAFAGARSGLVGHDDISEAASAMAPGTAAALLVYENTWARPFVSAARDADAEVIASARIPANVVNDVLDELYAADEPE